MKSLLPFRPCITLASVPAIGQMDDDAGNFTVRVRYQGLPIPGDCYFYTLFQGGGVRCGGNAFNLPVGSYTRTEGHGYPIPPAPFTITAGQTRVVDVAISGQAGIITGTFLLNGQPRWNPAFVRTGKEDGLAYTDNTGRFRFLPLAGPRIESIDYGLANFGFTAVAAQTRDLGTIGTTTLDSTIIARSGSLPSKTWTIRLSNIGANAASDTKLTGATFLAQSAGTACPLPVIASMLPLKAGFLPAGTNTTVHLQINFGTCQVNTRFTVKLDYQANGGMTIGNRTFNLQIP